MNFERFDSQHTQQVNQDSFSFKEVSFKAQIKPYVLRFWESEFEQIQPSVDDSGQKRYTSQDLDFILKVKSLLFEHKLSIPQAKAKLSRGEEFDEELKDLVEPDNLKVLKESLLQHLANLESICEQRSWS